MGVQVSWTKATKDGESPQGCLSFLSVPIRSLRFFLDLVLYSYYFVFLFLLFFFKNCLFVCLFLRKRRCSLSKRC